MQASEKTVSLGVSPGLIRVDELAPGEIFEGEFYIMNSSQGDATQSYSIVAAPLAFENINYDLSFSERNDFNQIVDWIEIEDGQGVLSPQERRAIKFRIAVPDAAPAGGQYASFLVSPNYATEAGSRSQGVSVENKSQIAILLYTTVDGETRREGTVLENRVAPLYLNRPIKTSSLVENTGNVHLPISYTLRIFPLFSNEEIYTNEENLEEKLVIPDTELYQEKTWEETPLLGLFRVQQDIDFGDRIDRKETVTLVAPTWFIILAFLFIASVMYGLIERISKLKEAKSQHQENLAKP